MWYRWQFYLTRPHKLVEEIYLGIKWFIQRGRRGYSDSDGWDIAGYLCTWMPEALDKMAKNKVGHPIGMTSRGWNTRLKQMSEGFRLAKKVQDLDYKKETIQNEVMRDQKRSQKLLKIFAEHFLSLWD